MIAAYLDESGNTGQRLDDTNQPFHHMGALVIPESEWLAVQSEAQHIAQSVPGTPELHGNLVFHGNRQWSGIDESTRIAIFDQCTDVVESHGLYMVIGTTDKAKLSRYAHPMDPRAIAFWMTLEQLAQATTHDGQLVYVVADQTDRNTRAVIHKLLQNYRLSGPPFGTPISIQHIIDTVHFMESHESWHLQLCDMALFGAQRSRRTGNGDFTPIFMRLNNRVFSKRTFPY